VLCIYSRTTVSQIPGTYLNRKLSHLMSGDQQEVQTAWNTKSATYYGGPYWPGSSGATEEKIVRRRVNPQPYFFIPTLF
jgi:hypothetical protein